MISKRKLALASTGGIRAGNAGFGVINTALLARLLDLENFGQYALVYAIILIVSIPARMGLPQLVIRETSYRLSEENCGAIGAIWRWAGRMVLGISVVATLIVALVALALRGQYDGAMTLLAGCLLVPLIALGNLRSAALRGVGRVVLGQLPEMVLRPALFCVVLVWMSLFAPAEQLTAAQALLWHAAAAAAAFGLGSVMLWRESKRLGTQNDTPFGGREMLISALALGATAGISTLNNNIDIVMIRMFLSDADVGIYRPAVTMASLVIFGLQVISTLITPQIAALYRQNERDKLERLVRKSARFSLGCSLIVLFGFGIFGQHLLVWLFGPEFAPAYLPLLILSLAHTINASFGSAVNLLSMSGHERETLQAIVIATLLNIVANAGLVAAMGLNGAAIGTLLSILLYKSLLTRVVHKKLGLKINAF
ncbi:MAG: flippase [Pelagimonas sp.]|jgi:O-antigen/teichoic acid export membrane protein|nr:flippase [Pelagimonas sp.]